MEGMTPREIDLRGSDGGMHARLAQALTDAAHYIRTHPDLPIPATVEISYCILAADDKDGRDELNRIAEMTGAHVTGDEYGETRKDFGTVSYHATYIQRDSQAAYDAHMAPYDAARAAERAAKSLARLHAAVDEAVADMEPRGAAA